MQSSLNSDAWPLSQLGASFVGGRRVGGVLIGYSPRQLHVLSTYSRYLRVHDGMRYIVTVDVVCLM